MPERDDSANGLLTNSPKCRQCGKPAIHIYPGEREGGPLPLCLYCSLKLQRFYEIEAAQLERDYNIAAAEFEMVTRASPESSRDIRQDLAK